MKNPFKASDLDNARGKRIKQAGLLEDAKALVAKREATVDQLSNDCAEAAAMEKAVIAHRDAEAMMKARLKALGETEAEIAALERREAEAADAKTRSETASAIAAMAEDLIRASEGFTTAMTELERTAGKVAAHFGQFYAFAAVMTNLKVEMPLTIAGVVDELKHRSASVVAGHGMAALPQPPIPAPPPPQPAPVQRVFTTRDVAWTDSDGRVCTSHPWWDVDLPPDAAAFALEKGYAVSTDDPIRRKQMGFGKATKPELSSCVRLNKIVASPLVSDLRVVEPTMRSVAPPTDQIFTVVDRGPAYAVRSNPKGDEP
jgi:hypothetical protein